MNGGRESHRAQEDPADAAHHHGRRPYWKRAHRDWRVWFAVFVMIAGMTIYVMSDDFALLSRSRQPDRVSDVHPHR